MSHPTLIPVWLISRFSPDPDELHLSLSRFVSDEFLWKVADADHGAYREENFRALKELRDGIDGRKSSDWIAGEVLTVTGYVDLAYFDELVNEVGLAESNRLRVSALREAAWINCSDVRGQKHLSDVDRYSHKVFMLIDQIRQSVPEVNASLLKLIVWAISECEQEGNSDPESYFILLIAGFCLPGCLSKTERIELAQWFAQIHLDRFWHRLDSIPDDEADFLGYAQIFNSEPIWPLIKDVKQLAPKDSQLSSFLNILDILGINGVRPEYRHPNQD